MWKYCCYQVLESSLKIINSPLVREFICFELWMCMHACTMSGSVCMQRTEITYLLSFFILLERQGFSLNLGLADWASLGFFLSLPPSAGMTGFFHGAGMKLSLMLAQQVLFPHAAISPAPALSSSKEDLFSLVRLQNQANVAVMWAQKRLGAGLANVLLPAVLGVSTCCGLGSAQDSSFCPSTATYQYLQRQAGHRASEERSCLFSVLVLLWEHDCTWKQS